MINIIYAALSMCAQTEKTTFHAKTTSAKLYIYILEWGQSTHGAGHIPLCGIFSTGPQRTKSNLKTGLRSNGCLVQEKSRFF